MPINYDDYPSNWLSEIRPQIMARSRGFCECNGECGVDHRGGRCLEHHMQPAAWSFKLSRVKYPKRHRWQPVKVVLTVAHYPDKTVSNVSPDNLKAMCQRCHLRVDHDDRMTLMRKRREDRRRQHAVGDMFIEEHLHALQLEAIKIFGVPPHLVYESGHHDQLPRMRFLHCDEKDALRAPTRPPSRPSCQALLDDAALSVPDGFGKWSLPEPTDRIMFG